MYLRMLLKLKREQKAKAKKKKGKNNNKKMANTPIHTLTHMRNLHTEVHKVMFKFELFEKWIAKERGREGGLRAKINFSSEISAI